jgi:hypothetical protein
LDDLKKLVMVYLSSFFFWRNEYQLLEDRSPAQDEPEQPQLAHGAPEVDHLDERQVVERDLFVENDILVLAGLSGVLASGWELQGPSENSPAINGTAFVRGSA